MANFDNAFAEVIGLEGSWVHHPNDTGGETKWGISKRWYPDVDIKNLTIERAKQIYWIDYWNPLLLALILDEDIATELFEQAINMGRRQAVKHAQQSINLFDTPITVDGIMGAQTVSAINLLGQRRKIAMLKCLNGFQFIRYLEIIERDPSQRVFFVGWLKRISGFHEQAAALV